MSEYTKEQEAEALAWMERDGCLGGPYGIVTAMAKRAAEAERERDALKARVVDLEAQVPCAWVALDAATRDVLATGRSLESVKAQAEKTGRSYILDKHHPPAITRLPSPPVVVTREMVEALREFVGSFALWGMGPTGDDLTKPVNAAARAVVAMNAALEVTP